MAALHDAWRAVARSLGGTAASAAAVALAAERGGRRWPSRLGLQATLPLPAESFWGSLLRLGMDPRFLLGLIIGWKVVAEVRPRERSCRLFVLMCLAGLAVGYCRRPSCVLCRRLACQPTLGPCPRCPRCQKRLGLAPIPLCIAAAQGAASRCQRPQPGVPASPVAAATTCVVTAARRRFSSTPPCTVRAAAAAIACLGRACLSVASKPCAFVAPPRPRGASLRPLSQQQCAVAPRRLGPLLCRTSAPPGSLQSCDGGLRSCGRSWTQLAAPSRGPTPCCTVRRRPRSLLLPARLPRRATPVLARCAHSPAALRTLPSVPLCMHACPARPPFVSPLPALADAEQRGRRYEQAAAELRGQVARLEGQVAELQAALSSAVAQASREKGCSVHGWWWW